MRTLVFLVLLMFGSVSVAQAPAPCPEAALPDDLKLICYQGQLILVSEKAQVILPLPVTCT